MALESCNANGCSCCKQAQKPAKPAKQKAKPKTINVHEEAKQAVVVQQPQPQIRSCGFGDFFGGIFAGLGQLCMGGAQLLGAMNQGGFNLGQMYLMNKMMKNNNHCCGHSSRPVIVNTYRSYPLVRNFCRPMPRSFCWRPNNICYDGPPTPINRPKPCFKPFGRNIC